MTKTLNAYVHSYIDGIRVTLKPGDPAPDWLKNPRLIVGSDDKATGEDAPVEDASVEEPAPKATQKRRGRPKKAEPTLAERARELGIEVDPDWSEAELEAQIALKE